MGNRIYERLLVPQAEGTFVIPVMEYTYFDPVAGTYQTITTQTISVAIAPGDDMVAVQPLATPVPGVTKETVAQLTTDIRHLKSGPAELSVDNGPVTESPLYWLAWGVPLVGLVGNFVWQRRQRFWQNNTGLARSSKARRKAKKALALANRAEDIYSAAGQVLTDYLADKLNQPVAGLTHQALAEHLTEQGLEPKLIERVNICQADAELGRFSPEADNPAHAKNLLKEVDVLIRDLEKVM